MLHFPKWYQTDVRILLFVKCPSRQSSSPGNLQHLRLGLRLASGDHIGIIQWVQGAIWKISVIFVPYILLWIFKHTEELGGVLVEAQQKRIRLVSVRMWVRSPALLSRLGIRHCRELWCRSQMWLGSPCCCGCGAASNSSDLTPSLGISICYRCGPKKQKMNKQTNNKQED